VLTNVAPHGALPPTLDTVISAISDPTRRAIIARLVRGPARVTDVAAPFAMSLPAISRHVKVLERAGLVRRARNGREHVLELDAKPLREVQRWTSQFERYWNERLDRLERHFAARKETPR
jgi:DNA-binding transcriptional ArsR family regulator